MKIKTRFKGWYVLVGSAVEHGAALAGMPARMVEIIRAGEQEDETEVARRQLLELLQHHFPDGRFKVAELVGLMDEGDRGAALKEAVNALAAKPLDAFTGGTVGTVLTKHMARVVIEDSDGRSWKVAPEKLETKSKKVSPYWEIRDSKTNALFEEGL